MISAEKQMLRLRALESLRAMSDAERVEKSAVIAAHLTAKLGGEAGMVFGFAPLRLEPDWTAAIRPSWEVALPRVGVNGMVFHRCDFKSTDGWGQPSLPAEGRGARPFASDFSELIRGAFGVREPAGGEEVPFAEASVVLVPGLAFDQAGGRLGRGGGFYDRLLADAALSTRRIAVCFACQIVEHVPVEPHDAEVEAIVTEDGWIDVRSSGCGRD